MSKKTRKRRLPAWHCPVCGDTTPEVQERGYTRYFAFEVDDDGTVILNDEGYTERGDGPTVFACKACDHEWPTGNALDGASYY